MSSEQSPEQPKTERVRSSVSLDDLARAASILEVDVRTRPDWVVGPSPYDLYCLSRYVCPATGARLYCFTMRNGDCVLAEFTDSGQVAGQAWSASIHPEQVRQAIPVSDRPGLLREFHHLVGGQGYILAKRQYRQFFGLDPRIPRLEEEW